MHLTEEYIQLNSLILDILKHWNKADVFSDDKFKKKKHTHKREFFISFIILCVHWLFAFCKLSEEAIKDILPFRL